MPAGRFYMYLNCILACSVQRSMLTQRFHCDLEAETAQGIEIYFGEARRAVQLAAAKLRDGIERELCSWIAGSTYREGNQCLISMQAWVFASEIVCF